MKSLSFMSKMAMVLGVAMLVVSCTKQQDSVTTNTTPTDAAVIKNVAGGHSYYGNISRSDAQEMYNNYKGKAGSGATEYVIFKISDLKAYIATVEAKGKTDEIYINLAVYDDKTIPAGKDAYVGRTTVFLSEGGAKAKTSRSGYKPDGLLFSDNVDYMNHGQIYP